MMSQKDSNQSIQWVEELPDKNQGNMGEFVAELKKRPGHWAIYPCKPSSNSGSCASMKSRYNVEAIIRQGKVYARYTGKEDGES